MVSLNELLEFYCMPGTLKIGSETNQILNVLIKVNTAKLAAEEAAGRAVQKSMPKLLVGKIKDTSILYSFFVDVKLIN